MSAQANNSLRLYKGGNPSTIEQLLSIQDSDVVDELMEHFHCTRDELPVRLSMGF